jgi:hypothetical protein
MQRQLTRRRRSTLPTSAPHPSICPPGSTSTARNSTPLPTPFCIKDANGVNFGSIDRGLNNGASNYNALQVYCERARCTTESSSPRPIPGRIRWTIPAAPSTPEPMERASSLPRPVRTCSQLRQFGSGSAPGLHLQRAGRTSLRQGKMFLSNAPWARQRGDWRMACERHHHPGVRDAHHCHNRQLPLHRAGWTIHPGGGMTNRADLTGKISYPKKLTNGLTPRPSPSGGHQPERAEQHLHRSGNAGPQQHGGTGYRDLDASIGKDFPFVEGVAMRISPRMHSTCPIRRPSPIPTPP